MCNVSETNHNEGPVVGARGEKGMASKQPEREVLGRSHTRLKLLLPCRMGKGCS